MAIALFCLYAVVLGFLITKCRFLVNSGLAKKYLVALFFLYSVAGCVHTWIAYHYFPNHGDLWEIFNNSVLYKHQLLHDYPAFKKEFFPDRFYIDLAGTHLGWSYYQQTLLASLQVIFDFLSDDNIYINVLLFNFIVLFGRVAFYRMLTARYPHQALKCGLVAFLIPSVSFWTSVIHKEGLLICCIGTLLYCLQKLFAGEKTAGKLIVALLMLVLIFLTRKAVMITIVPALTIWWLAEKTKLRLRYIIVLVCGLFGLLLTAAGSFGDAYDLVAQLGLWQHEFLKLHGGSRITLPPLGTDVRTFVHVFPYALFNGLLTPLPGTGGQWLYNLFSVEIVVWLGLIIWFVFRKQKQMDGFLAGFLIFALGGCLIIGFTVPFAGAIVRYRSVFFPFLLAPFLLDAGARFWPASATRKSN